MNMGAWRYIRITLGQKIFGRHQFWGVYRPGSASPATGSGSAHKKEQEIVLQEAFDIKKKKAVELTMRPGAPETHELLMMNESASSTWATSSTIPSHQSEFMGVHLWLILKR
jgi:hypothetical protein